ncbi:MAG: signal peptidase II [Lachnospiraceae bacterium]|nr:signal peptidase II [Lachnospiraceae bacterium]
MSKKKTKAILLCVDAIIAAILIVLDQIIKSKVVEVLADGKEHKFIPGFIYLIYLKNTGAAFSSFQNQKWLLVLISILFMALIAFVMFKLPIGKKFIPANILFSLVIAGGIGNMIDRIKQSYVVDYLGFDFWRSYPIFNFADICVVIGVIGLFLLFIFVYNEKDLDFLRIFEKKNKAEEE